ncbi:hypothetical protein [Halosimplex halophilum]|uniref:hypothetical protein n=1 Tax=Halosimplex halophilum TaxID=2559572 RepID=UPI00107F7D87|nr:hypothetical protein [Halosimplex halophilum]
MRRFAIAGIVLMFAVVGGATVALSALTSEDRPANATVSTFEPRVAVGNQSEHPYPDSDGVVTCNDRGPMPGDAGLSGSLVVERPLRDDGPPEPSFRVNVSVDGGALVETHTVTLSTGGSERLVLLRTADRPPSLDGGDTVPVRATVTTENTTVATASRTVEVTERDVPCADEN